MGRPLKVRKANAAADPSGLVDYGFPNDQTTNNDWDDNEPGVTGGYDGAIRVTANLNLPGAGTLTANTASATVTGTGTVFDYNGMSAGATVYADGVNIGTINTVANATSFTLTANSAANVTGATFTFDTGAKNAWILRQKGKRKYMCALDLTIQDEGIAEGGKYFIHYNPVNSDWAFFGAGPDAAYGKVFTSTANGVGVTTDGAVKPVEVCTLVDGTPNVGEVQIEVYNNGTTTNALSLTNHWVRDFDNDVTPEDGTNTKFVATIFNDSGNVDPATNYTIVGIENWC